MRDAMDLGSMEAVGVHGGGEFDDGHVIVDGKGGVGKGGLGVEMLEAGGELRSKEGQENAIDERTQRAVDGGVVGLGSEGWAFQRGFGRGRRERRGTVLPER